MASGIRWDVLTEDEKKFVRRRQIGHWVLALIIVLFFAFNVGGLIGSLLSFNRELSLGVFAVITIIGIAIAAVFLKDQREHVLYTVGYYDRISKDDESA